MSNALIGGKDLFELAAAEMGEDVGPDHKGEQRAESFDDAQGHTWVERVC